MPIDLRSLVLGGQADGQLKENETTSNLEGLSGYGTDFGSKEARLALAIAAAGSGASGSSDILDLLTQIADNTDQLEISIDGGNISIDKIDMNTNDLEQLTTDILAAVNALAEPVVTDLLSEAGVASAIPTIIRLSNSNIKCRTIQNKSDVASIFYRPLEDVADLGSISANNAFELLPKQTLIQTNKTAKVNLVMFAEAGTSPKYFLQEEIV